jgi:hypothetical protein
MNGNVDRAGVVEQAICLEQFWNYDFQLMHEMLHGIRFRDQPWDIVAGGNPDPSFLIPERFHSDIFTYHVFSIPFHVNEGRFSWAKLLLTYFGSLCQGADDPFLVGTRKHFTAAFKTFHCFRLHKLMDMFVPLLTAAHSRRSVR